MNTESRSSRTGIEEVPYDVVQLQASIDSLPETIREQLAPALRRVVEGTQRRRKIMNLVQDALSQVRLDMKYLMFDLEATRRERDDYRRQLGEI
ncbi:MAG TPA: transcriptional regulator [Pirellulales bacterium]|jgi:protein-L-isoaspartate O-methyltransferase|nr:transcriptional regulator [Pirellulales bacterium]